MMTLLPHEAVAGLNINHLLEQVSLQLTNGNEVIVQPHRFRAEASTHEEWRVTVDKGSFRPVTSPTYTGEVVIKLELRIPVDQLEDNPGLLPPSPELLQ